jgi:hypothetical protein
MTDNEEHYTAWLTTDPTCLPDHVVADVSILRDRRDDDGNWGQSDTEPLAILPMTAEFLRAGGFDYESNPHAVVDGAQEALHVFGWERVGHWTDVGSGFCAEARRLPGLTWRMLFQHDEARHTAVCNQHGEVYAVTQSDPGFANAILARATFEHQVQQHDGTPPHLI